MGNVWFGAVGIDCYYRSVCRYLEIHSMKFENNGHTFIWKMRRRNEWNLLNIWNLTVRKEAALDIFQTMRLSHFYRHSLNYENIRFTKFEGSQMSQTFSQRQTTNIFWDSFSRMVQHFFGQSKERAYYILVLSYLFEGIS